MKTVTFDEKTHAIVPKKPTKGMILAGDTEMDGISHLGSAWDLMLDAAPPYKSVEVSDIGWVLISERLPRENYETSHPRYST
jgi:hypothetical protein